MSASLVITGLLSAGGATIIAAVLNAFFNRRKLSAEATEIITKAAAGTVENIMADNAALRADLAALKLEVEQLTQVVRLAERRERAHDLIQERWVWHMGRWHRHAGRLAEENRALGGSPSDPPPLWPEPVKLDF